MRSLVLQHRWALGDTVVMTAFVRDLATTYPDKYDRLLFDTNWTVVWKNNPYIERYDPKTHGRVPRVELAYRNGIISAGRGTKVHFLAWFHKDFEQKTGIKVPVTKAGGDIHLTDQEKEPIVGGDYWLILSGGKLDVTTKHWNPEWFQLVVDVLRGYGIRFVQVGATHNRHIHPPLKNCLNLVGKTDNVRDLFTLIYNCQGIVCGVTGAMHIAACFEKPCVVINGGREEPHWEGYFNSPNYKQFGETCPPVKVPHRFLNVIGKLDCCMTKGCWKKKTVPLDHFDVLKRKGELCKRPIRRDGKQPLPECMLMIKPEVVVESVLSYYLDGTLKWPTNSPELTRLDL